MKRAFVVAIGLVILGLAGIYFTNDAAGQSTAAWTTLFDGKDLSSFNTVGDANWAIVDGAVQANKGTGFLLTKTPYANFELIVEFWVDDDANSGVFLRCSDPQMISASTAYEVNIFDKRPDQTYRTGAIVDVAKPLANINAGGKWNTFEITAQGSRLVVKMNGTPMVDVQHTGHARGPVALQYGAGIVKFRKVQIRPL